MLKIRYENRMLKDLKLIRKRGYDIQQFEDVVRLLSTQQPLPAYYHDHALIGNYKGYRECHIQPDWLLIYKIVDEDLLLILTRTGTHSDLF